MLWSSWAKNLADYGFWWGTLCMMAAVWVLTMSHALVVPLRHTTHQGYFGHPGLSTEWGSKLPFQGLLWSSTSNLEVALDSAWFATDAKAMDEYARKLVCESCADLECVTLAVGVYAIFPTVTSNHRPPHLCKSLSVKHRQKPCQEGPGLRGPPQKFTQFCWGSCEGQK